MLYALLNAPLAADLPDVGATDRYRVDIPGWPGAEATSASGSVLLAPPPPGTPWRVEEAPVSDGPDGTGVGSYAAAEAIEALGAADWHAAGLRGAGVKVAIFDVQWFNAEAWSDELGEVSTHDCQEHRSCDPPMDTLRPRYAFEEASHGVACAEVIRDIAPDAELHLVRVNGATTLENAAAWAVREDIDVVSMSMSFFNTSFYDGSGVVGALADTMAQGGVLLVTSAGNYAKEHWDGEFQDTDGDDAMDFPWRSGYLPVYYGAGVGSLVVNWDQYDRCGETDLDLYVYDGNGTVVGRAEGRQDADADNCSPVERVRITAPDGDWYYLRIVRRSGSASTRVAVYAREAESWRTTPGGLADPASHPSSFTVGAVRADGYVENESESFSSTGPSHAGVAKPDIAGPDGLSTGVYGPVGFYGTSAATPAVAGAIALLLSESPSLTPREAADRLIATAIGDGATWRAPDGERGAGYARLPPLAPFSGACGGGASAGMAPVLLLLSCFRRRSA